MSFIAELKNKRIIVVGAGTTGRAVANYLNTLNVDYCVIDERVQAFGDIVVISKLPADISFNLAIVSPGWHKEHQVIRDLIAAGTQIVGELDFAWELAQELNPEMKWVALTGTNGKTTTIRMVESMLLAAGKSGIACGNVGTTVIEAVTNSKCYEVLALELSSFQIEWSEKPKYEVVAILNIAEDHIDWHGSFDKYANSKMKLLQQSEIAILNLNDAEVILRSAGWGGRKVFFGFDTPQFGELGIVEELIIDRAFVPSPEAAEVIAELNDLKPAVPHNVANAMAAAAIALALGIAHNAIKRALANFKIDGHRLETILENGGVTWVNDSKATNPHAASAALMSHLSNIWIAGGLSKGAKMDELILRTKSRIKAAIIIGQDGDLIAKALEKSAPDVKIFRISNSDNPAKIMDDVVTCAIGLATSGDTVLLAPACASMDQFTSYVQRGELFSESVNRLVSK